MADTKQHICRVGTARIDYRGHAGQCVLNTTIKSGTGLGAVFAPIWKMVMASKQGKLSWQAYIEEYTALMRQRYANNPEAFLEAMNSDELIVCCYCHDTHDTTKHCHRYILVEILEKVAAHQGLASSMSAKSTTASDELALFLPSNITFHLSGGVKCSKSRSIRTAHARRRRASVAGRPCCPAVSIARCLAEA